MIRVCFVCLGNICRSPMAEFIFKKIVREAGMTEFFEISSAGTSDEEEGNPVDRRAQNILAQHGISAAGKYARQLTVQDFNNYDYFVCMDSRNLSAMYRLFHTDQKQQLLYSFTGVRKDIADPWYSGDFTTAFYEIEQGCKAFLEHLIAEKKIFNGEF